MVSVEFYIQLCHVVCLDAATISRTNPLGGRNSMAARSTVAVFLSLALVLGDDCLEDQNVQMLQLDTSIDEKKHHSEKSRSRKTHRKSLQNCGHLILACMMSVTFFPSVFDFPIDSSTVWGIYCEEL